MQLETVEEQKEKHIRNQEEQKKRRKMTEKKGV